MRIRPLVVSTLALSLIASGFQKQLETPYQKWLNEDVAYIVTDEERQAWQRLATDEEREHFIEQFWLHRDPTPDTAENESKEEHYRRIAYANERFGSGIPGWKTDRGAIYIALGPPDEIESHPSGGTYHRPPTQGGGTITTYPFEEWRYRWIEALGAGLVIEFVNKTGAGEYRMTLDPSEKDVSGRASTHLPMQVRADYFPLTEASACANITVQLENKDLHLQPAVANVHGRITTMTGQVMNVFDDTITVESPSQHSVYQRSLTLPPGEYRLNLVLQDLTGGKMNNLEMALNVPRFEPDGLGRGR